MTNTEKGSKGAKTGCLNIYGLYLYMRIGEENMFIFQHSSLTFGFCFFKKRNEKPPLRSLKTASGRY